MEIEHLQNSDTQAIHNQDLTAVCQPLQKFSSQ